MLSGKSVTKEYSRSFKVCVKSRTGVKTFLIIVSTVVYNVYIVVVSLSRINIRQ